MELKGLIFAVLVHAVVAHAADAEHNWGQWRGPSATGVAPHADPPLEWSDTKNIRWKAELPGRGHSTPVVWDDRVYITTAIAFGDPVPPPAGVRPGSHDNLVAVRGQDFAVVCLNRRDGKVLWQKNVAKEVPHESGHQTASFASHSPVTDGESVFAYFGSAGLFCLDCKTGDVKWKANFGQMHSLHGHGEGNSPALSGDTLLINWDHEGPSFIVALDKRTGKERWKTVRDEVTSWSTPIVVEVSGKKQVIVSATHRIRAYDLDTGVEVWQCGGMSTNVVASPVSADGYLYAGSSYEKRAMIGIKLEGAKGDITGSEQVAWFRNRDTCYVPSPLLYGDRLYFLKHYQGALSCLRAKTGEVLFGPQRIPNVFNVYGSPVAAAERIYITSREGTTSVLKLGDALEVLATNTIDDTFNASAALVDRELFLRGEKYLYCIAKEE